MEIDIKENILAFNRGISNTPSDLLCDDGSLSACDGMVSINGELKAVQKAKEISTLNGIDGTLMYVHRLNSGDVHYIYYKSGTGLKYGSTLLDNSSSLAVTKVDSVGNTLIVNTTNGLYYYLWGADTITNDSGQTIDVIKYKYLGNNIPEPKVYFSLSSAIEQIETQENVGSLINGESGADKNNLFVGLYSKCKKELEEAKAFVNPFFVRYALEMYDGSYMYASAPIIMYPSVKRSSYFKSELDENNKPKHLSCICFGAKMHYKAEVDYSSWSDLINGVSIFVTRGVELFDTNADVDVTGMATNDLLHNHILNGKYAEEKVTQNPFTRNSKIYGYLKGIPNRISDVLVDDLKSERVFYKLCDIGRKPTDSDNPWADISTLITKDKIKNIEVQEQLTGGDYFSHCNLHAKDIVTFNRRLNIFGVERDFYNGFDHFSSYNYNDSTTNQSRTYIVKVYIRTPEGIKKVYKTITTHELMYKNMYFYYPDPRACNVDVYDGKADSATYRKHLFGLQLKEHPGLNGAYNLGELPEGKETITSDEEPKVEINPPAPTPEHLGNYVLQSEVDNPFTFNASGYVRVGQGDVIGLAGLTTALSQDAYKIATTIAFTTQGIWALQIDSTGQYMQVTPPFSREVCENGNTITMTDDAVFFVSKKGLMCVVGTNEQSVVCVSNQMRGKGFDSFYEDILNAKIAYDYKEGFIYLFGSTHKWVFNIKDKTWVRANNIVDGTINAVVNDYPDNIIQSSVTSGDTTTNKCWTLIGKDNRDDDENQYYGIVETRALKFDGATVLKSLLRVKNLMSMDKDKVVLKIYGTNNLLGTWNEITSTRGKSWRFFKAKLIFHCLDANESYCGLILMTQRRYTDKIR